MEGKILWTVIIDVVLKFFILLPRVCKSAGRWLRVSEQGEKEDSVHQCRATFFRQRKLLLKLFIWRKCDKPGTTIGLFLNRKYMQPQDQRRAKRLAGACVRIRSYTERSLGLLCCLDCAWKAEKKANMQPASRITINSILSCPSTAGLSCQVMPLSASLSVPAMQAPVVAGGTFAVPSKLSPASECLCLPCSGSTSLPQTWCGLRKIASCTWSQLTENEKGSRCLGCQKLLAVFWLF